VPGDLCGITCCGGSGIDKAT